MRTSLTLPEKRIRLIYHGNGMCYKAGRKCPLIAALIERKLIPVYKK